MGANWQPVDLVTADRVRGTANTCDISNNAKLNLMSLRFVARQADFEQSLL